ncbi:MAG TPA: ABC transporter ATP-binding protein [Gemmatimonadales bacterium]|nr:ABC transporter ATP-binding protein [Gemmatimonadales bacterium]
MLSVQAVKRFGAFSLEVALNAVPGETLMVVGESGAGKSTLLRILAGLVQPDQGCIAAGEVVLFDDQTRTDLPAWQRPIGYVPQDYALFPHLTVFENVAFGLRASGQANARIGPKVRDLLGRFGIADLAGRHAREISGGQAQRVALARALVLDPEILLLDEPLAALDLATQQALRGELRRLLADLPCISIYVTHQPLEAMVLGTRIAAIEHGRITQIGTRDELLRRPRSSYVAAFLGINLFRGTIVGRERGTVRVRTPLGDLFAIDPGGDDDVFLVVRPTEITLYRESVLPEGSARNYFAGTVVELAPEPPHGERVRVVLATHPPLVAEVTDRAVEQLALKAGTPVYATFKATGIDVFR